MAVAQTTVASPRLAEADARRLGPRLALARIGADGLALALGLRLAFELRQLVVNRGADLHDSSVLLGLAAVPLWLIIFARYRLYSSRITTSRLEEFKAIAHAVGASVVVTAGITYLLGFQAARGWLAVVGFVAVPLVAVEREIVRSMVVRMRQRGRLLRPVLVLGARAASRTVGDAIVSNPSLGYRLLGYVGIGEETEPAGPDPDPYPQTLGEVGQINALIELTGASGVIAAEGVDGSCVNRLARELTSRGISVQMILPLRDIDSRRLASRRLGRFSVVQIEPVLLGWRTAAKRAFDVVVSAVLLLVLAPVLGVVALLVKATSPGPALFRQERVGKDGERFRVFKFRTMVDNAELLMIDLVERNQADGPLFKLHDDPRITAVGRFLRGTSMDELPQLWNVLRGEMSLVGPRPALSQEMASWPPELHQRLRVKPGLTGMWQVGGRSNLSFGEYVRLDLYYVDNWSLLTDLLILLQTVPVVLLRRGGY